MKEEKVKVNLRVGLLIRETLVDEAAVEDIRVGTLANRLLQSEMDKVMKVGADNCLIMNSREYLASEAEIEQNRAAYYLFPETKVVSRFIATQLDDKIYPQISFYFLKEQMDALEKLVELIFLKILLATGWIVFSTKVALSDSLFCSFFSTRFAS